MSNFTNAKGEQVFTSFVDAAKALIPKIGREAYDGLSVQEIDRIDGRWVAACPLPTDYFTRLRQGALPKLTKVGEIQAAAEGYADYGSFSRAQLNQWIAERMEAARAARAPEALRVVREFHPSHMDASPEEVMGQQGKKAFRAEMQLYVMAILDMDDFDEQLEIAPLKEIDGMLAMYERLMYGVELAAIQTKKELTAACRLHDDGEISIQQIERLELRLKGLRLQYWTYKQKFEAVMTLRPEQVARWGRDWAPYVPLAERAKKGEQAWAAKQRSRAAMAFTASSQPWNQKAADKRTRDYLRRYEPRKGGIDADDGMPISGASDYE